MTINHEEMVILVDEQDRELGLEEKLRAHELGLLHRAFSVFIFRRNGNIVELLLQQRQQYKYHCGGLWTNTCCSHPRAGENVVAAGQRRLQEEMGFSSKLEVAGTFKYRAEFTNGLIEHEYDHVLVGSYKGESIIVDPLEVQAYNWISVSDLQSNLVAEPKLYTPWLAKALEIALTTNVVLPTFI
jgi:isopentenyl-diphosphate delta-isomerase